MWNKVVALYSYLLFGLLVLFALVGMAVLLVVTLPFDRDRLIAGRFLRRIAVLVGVVCPIWRLELEGGDRRPEGAFVAVANHESMLDIFLISAARWEMKWVAKASLFKVPVFGLLFRMSGDIPVDREDRESGSSAARRAEEYLSRGVPVMFFPEGTRSKTDELRPFKLGAFRAAIRSGCPILPIAVYGTKAGMPVGTPWIRPARARGRVLDPIPTTGLTLDDAQALADRVRAIVIQGRAELAGAPELSSDAQARPLES